MRLTEDELVDRLLSPFAVDVLADPDGTAVVVEPGLAVDAEGHEVGLARGVLASLPCVVVADGWPCGARPALADAVADPAVATVDDVLAGVAANPVAATSLALLLRDAERRPAGAGLVAESAVYSMLQAGPEFARWRASRPVRPPKATGRPAVRVERHGERLDLVLDRPEARNALDTSLRDGWLVGLAVAAADPAIAEVVIRGEGPTFCSGGDLDEFGSFSDPASAHVVRLVASIGRAIDALGDRVRCEVHGPCAGSGVELPAFAARVVAASDHTAGLPEVGLGLVPGAGGTLSVTRRVGRHRTALLALSGARVDARTSLRWGLVDELDGVRVRRLGPGEIELLKRLRLRSLREEPDAFGSTWDHEAAFADSVWADRLRPDGLAQLVCERAGEPVGVAAVGHLVGPPDVVHLVGVWVDPAARGTGAIDALVVEASRAARAAGAAVLRLDVTEGNHRAERAYARAGFTRTGSTFTRDRDGRVEVEMDLPLT